VRILVTGASGMLGHALLPVLKQEHTVIGLTRENCDLCDEDEVEETFQRLKPDAIAHLAAFTNVDGCELEPEKAKASNELATFNVAEAARRLGARLLYVSTDYVFDGRTTEPYSEESLPNPLSVYGKTKLMGERYVQGTCDRYFIVRTSWLFGPGGRNFVSTILRLANEQKELRIVNDQRGSPTYTRHLAQKLVEIIRTHEYGTYHVTGGGNCTWFEFARKIVDLSGLEGVQFVPISSEECGRPAPRPAYSVLANNRLRKVGIGPLPRWEKGLTSYLAEICKQGELC